MKSTISILVVDDEAMIRNLLEKILAKEGYKILLAKDGQEALDIISTKKVDIVISDMKMPRMNGLDLLKTLKRERPEIGVVIMTGYGDTYTVKDALLLGADEYITKPFKSYEMLMIVERTYWRILAGTNITPENKE
ncbi:MAG TPA: response regulator [candidate division Zixibacteria bacterium]|nr:response regulator [candidate division Zixibacteria bacterium]